MENRWMDYDGKKVYIILKNGRRYSGIVKVEVTEVLVWIHMIDKFKKRITFVAGEIHLIQEEE